jgi:ElaB/YqjD/DUF883 family membrane-anchored ribosome-binding protein
MKINLEGIQNLFAEQQVKAGKVPLLESDNEDLKRRLKRYENTEKEIMNELNNVTNQKNDLLKQIDDYIKKNPLNMNAAGRKSSNRGTLIARSGINPSTTDSLLSKSTIYGGGNLKNIQINLI